MSVSKFKARAEKRVPRSYSSKTTKSNFKIAEASSVYLKAAPKELKQFGTFADSKKAPIHCWFQYPAGFSYRAVEHLLQVYGVHPGDLVYDPFVGTGTTVVVCKRKGIESYGVEAHPFVHKIASAKTNWNFDLAELINEANQITFELDLTRHRSELIDSYEI